MLVVQMISKIFATEVVYLQRLPQTIKSLSWCVISSCGAEERHCCFLLTHCFAFGMLPAYAALQFHGNNFDPVSTLALSVETMDSLLPFYIR